MSSVGNFLVIGFIPDNKDHERDGVHTPLRSDGYYGYPPIALAEIWRAKPVNPKERVVIVQIVSDRDGDIDENLPIDHWMRQREVKSEIHPYDAGYSDGRDSILRADKK